MHNIYDSIQNDEMNKDILKGIARKLGGDTVGFVNNLWKDSLRALPKEMLDKEIIVYHGYSVIPIHERNMKEKGKSYSPSRQGEVGQIDYAIDQSDHIPVNFKFGIKENGVYEDVYVTMRLPYIGRHGITKFSGSSYYVTPILSDVLITPDKQGAFIKPDGIKFKVKTENVTITCLAPDKHKFIKMFASIATSEKMRGGAIVNNKDGIIYGMPKVPIHLYVFFKYGLEEIYGKEIHLIKSSEISTFHKKGYFIYSVPDTKPKKHLKWEKSDIYIAVKEEPDVHSLMVIASVLQVLYFFPFTGKEMLTVIGTKQESGFWEVAVGRMIYKGLRSDAFMLREVRALFTKFESYISGRIIAKLEGIGFNNVTCFFGFLRELLIKLEGLKADHLAYTNSFANREIDIYYYLMYPYIEGINKIMNAITKAYNTKVFTRKDFKGITTKDYSKEALLRQIFKTPISLTLTKTEASSDNIYFKMTSTMIPQEIGKGTRRKNGSKQGDSIPANMQGLHASFAFVGNVLKLPKSTPVALASINCFLQIDNNGKFIFDKQAIRTMKATDEVLNETGRDISSDSDTLSYAENVSDD